MLTFKKFYEMKSLDAHPGDEVENINKDCEHYRVKGIVKRTEKRPEKRSNKVDNGHNTPGRDIVIYVTNKTKNAKPGDEITKSAEQIEPIKK